MERSETPPRPGRRAFLEKISAVLLGAVALLVPLFSGVVVLLDPLRRKTGNSAFIKVAALNSLPADGVPRKFSVLADHTDAWNRALNVPVGAIYLRRLPENQVQALNVVCPHAGCFVDYSAAKNGYLCPCHNSVFALDGQIADPKSPSPRGLDPLPVEIRNGSEIWVEFQNYRAGIKARIPV